MCCQKPQSEDRFPWVWDSLKLGERNLCFLSLRSWLGGWGSCWSPCHPHMLFPMVSPFRIDKWRAGTGLGQAAHAEQWLRRGTHSTPAPAICKGNNLCRVRTTQGTSRVPVGAPGMGNESQLTFRLAHMTNGPVQWWREMETGCSPSMHIPVNFPEASTSNATSEQSCLGWQMKSSGVLCFGEMGEGKEYEIWFSGFFFSPLRVNGTIGNHAAKKDSFAWEAKAKTRLDAQKG